MGQHQLLVKKLAALMEAARPSVPDTHNPGVLEKGMARVFNGVNTVHGEGLRCKLVEKEFASKSFAVMLVSQPPTLPELMDATLTRDQRKLANAALFPVFTEFLAQQPPLYKLAARVVKKWAFNNGPAFCKWVVQTRQSAWAVC
jgi:hypothetical protein